MFTVTIPSPDVIHMQASRAIARGIGLTGTGCFLRTTGGKVTYAVGWAGCGCPIARVEGWCQHRSLYAIAFGQVEPPKRVPPAPIPFVPRKQRQEWRPRPLRTPRPPIPFRPRSAA